MTTFAEYRRVGDSWFIAAETDREESEHRIDLLAGDVFCTCRGFRKWRHCKHSDEVRSYLMVEERHLLVQDHPPGTNLPDVWRSPSDLRRRLADLEEETGLVQQFFKNVMVPSRPGEADGDYGIIPGTEKPTLFKAGAEKLCELYGYGINIADVQETTDYDTGHYRVVARVALIHKGSGVRVAEGIGECNTHEAKYHYRWVFVNDVPAGLDKSRMKTKEITSRKTKQKYTMYRLENDDLFSIWNTILKMAKKRALVDATLSATRSSGLFTQTAEHLDEWIDAEFSDVTETAAAPACDHGPGKVRTLMPADRDRHNLRPDSDMTCICECGVLFTDATCPPGSEPMKVYRDTHPPEPGAPLLRRDGSSRGSRQATEGDGVPAVAPAPVAAPPAKTVEGEVSMWWASTRRMGLERDHVLAVSQALYNQEPIHLTAVERDAVACASQAHEHRGVYGADGVSMRCEICRIELDSDGEPVVVATQPALT